MFVSQFHEFEITDGVFSRSDGCVTLEMTSTLQSLTLVWYGIVNVLVLVVGE